MSTESEQFQTSTAELATIEYKKITKTYTRNGETVWPDYVFSIDWIVFVVAGYEEKYISQLTSKLVQIWLRTAELAALEVLENTQYTYMREMLWIRNKLPMHIKI